MRRQTTPRIRVAAVITIAIALAVLLRLWGLRWGLPCEQHYNSYHPDEFAVISAAIAIEPLSEGLQGLNPHFFNYGTLYIFLAALAKSIGIGYGWIRLDAQGPQIYVEFGKIHLAARMVNVLFGAATAFLVYALGRKLYGRAVGVLAAIFVAIAPILCAHAHYATVDTTAAFWATLSVVFAARALESCRARDFAWAGVFAGFAGGTKYNAGLVIISVAAAILMAAMTLKERRFRTSAGWAGGALACGAIAFVIATPGVLIAHEEFRAGLMYEMGHAGTGHGNVFTNTAVGWWYHIIPNMPFALGAPLTVLALSGVAAAMIRRTRSDWLLLAWIVPYYFLIGTSEVKFMRYLIPIIPAMLILAAKLGRDLAVRARGGLSIPGCVIVALVMLWTGTQTVRYNAAFTRIDPRDEAAAWIADHASRDTVGMVAAPWFYSAPITPWNGGQLTQPQFEMDASRNRIVLTGWDVPTLESDPPGVYTISEFEYRDGLRIRSPETIEFIGALDATYNDVEEFGRGALPIIFPFTREQTPHDYLYPAPITRVYHNSMEHN